MTTTLTQVDTVPLTDISRPDCVRLHNVIPSHHGSDIPTSHRASPRVFESEPTTTLNKSRRVLITTLVILASLTQVRISVEPVTGKTSANLCKYAANFVTLAGGLAFSKKLGRDVGPGEANWMPAAYS